MPGWLIWPLTLIVLLYVGGPLIILLTFKQRVYAEYQPLQPEQLPQDVFSFFSEHAAQLAAEGFSAALYARQSGAVAGVHAYVSIWHNRDRGQQALLGLVIPTVGRATRWIEFETVGAQPHRTIESNNIHREVGIFEVPGWRDVRYFPWLRTVPELYRVHLWRERDRLPAGAVRYVPANCDVIGSLTNSTRFLLQEQVRRGFMRATREAGVFRLTVYGAFAMVMRMLPPGKQLRTLRARRAARVEMRRARQEPVSAPSAVPVTDVSPISPSLSADRLTYA
jgi:hypothetical protein